MQVLRWLDRSFEETLAVLLLGAIVVLVAANVVARYALNASLSWGEELVGWVFIWFIWIAVSYVFRRDTHITITLLPDMLSPAAQRWLRSVVRVAMIVFLATISVKLIALIQNPMVRNQMSVVLQMPIPLYYASAPVGALLSCLRILQALWRDLSTPLDHPRGDFA